MCSSLCHLGYVYSPPQMWFYDPNNFTDKREIDIKNTKLHLIDVMSLWYVHQSRITNCNIRVKTMYTQWLSMVRIIMEMQHACRNVSILHTYLSMRYATFSRCLFSQNSVGQIWLFYTIFFICRCRIFFKIWIVIFVLTLFNKIKINKKLPYN